jgi:uncharacterized membrane protein
MIAVKEALSVPDGVFLPMVVVDTVVPYVWMGILIAAVKWQPAFDTWNRSDRTVLDELKRNSNVEIRNSKQDPNARNPNDQNVSRFRSLDHSNSFRISNFGFRVSADPGNKRNWWKFIGIRLIIIHAAILAGVCSRVLGEHLPTVPNVISASAWTIIIVTALALVLSFTPARRCEHHGAPGMGQRWLFFVLTAIGAKASLSNLGASAVLIAAGCVIVAVHFVFLLIGARMTRAPLFLVAAASQANIGGVASAPVVAAVYQPGLASVGLLLAILGNIVGTYLGILCGQLCRWLI